MNMRKKFLGLIAGLAAGIVLASSPGLAASVQMCAPEQSSGAQVRRVVVSSSTASPQPAYQLNGQGCAVIALADVGFFQSLGFTQASSQNTILYATGALASSGTTDIVIGNLPPSAYIQHIIVSNSANAAVTGGLSFGTTANGTDIVTALTCAATCLTYVTDANLKLRVFSNTVSTPLHMAPVTSSNSANLTVSVIYGFY